MVHRRWLLAVVATLTAVGMVGLAESVREYQLEILMPSADGAFEGGSVMLRGEHVGEIADVGVKGNKALLTVDVEDAYAPLHAGTSARVSWQSVIGSRAVELLPGSTKNPPLPSGKMIVSNNERVELEDVLDALDKPTRARLQGLLTQLAATLHGREGSLRATLRSGGPTVEALGEVLDAVAEDGPAIRRLVSRLRSMTSALIARDRELGGTVTALGRLTSATAQEQAHLRAAIDHLPPAVTEATKTLERVPEAVDATVPVLRDLRPATRRLPSVAAKLSPVLRELRPTVAMLRPTLASTRSLLGYTPGLLDTAHGTLPGLKDAVVGLQPAVAFLRPYTPELGGWLSNWTSTWASENGSGNYVRALIISSSSSFNGNPGVVPPGLQQTRRPAPGELVGQPWTDANGDSIQ